MAVTIDAFDQLIELMSDGTIDMDDATADTFKMLLSTAYTFNALHTIRTDVNGSEHANGNGYATNGASLTTVTWTFPSAGTIKWDSDDVTWNATGAGMSASDGIIYDETTTSPLDAVMIAVDFDGTQAAGAGTDFIVAPNASNGWFTGSFTAG
jgi:hypothetical protein